ncbi:hypothetical protein HOD29_04850 [archaeon]|jgi:hypothetical protein|nr:hypothetical protein [archaeon]
MRKFRAKNLIRKVFVDLETIRKDRGFYVRVPRKMFLQGYENLVHINYRDKKIKVYDSELIDKVKRFAYLYDKKFNLFDKRFFDIEENYV